MINEFFYTQNTLIYALVDNLLIFAIIRQNFDVKVYYFVFNIAADRKILLLKREIWYFFQKFEHKKICVKSGTNPVMDCDTDRARLLADFQVILCLFL